MNMRKTKIAFLIVLILLFCAALPAGAFAEERSAVPFSPDGSVLFEKDGVKVTTAGLDTDPTTEDSEPVIWLEIENTGSEDAYLGVTDGSVNGFMTDVVLIRFYTEEEDGCFGGDYRFDLTVPAGGSERRALGCYGINVPGVKLDELHEIAFRFTLAEEEYAWPSFRSEPVVITVGEAAEPVDIASLGTAVFENDDLTIVLGEQDYDDWLGPMVYVYAENRSDHYIGISADEAHADGVDCDYVLYGAVTAPGKISAAFMSFDGEMQAMRGFENLSVRFSLYEAATADELYMTDPKALDPVSLQYPPQRWGVFENEGLTLEIQPKYNALVTVKTPAADPDGILFEVSETASLEAAGYDGAGWLFSIGRVSEDRLHEMLCWDMSGASVFAKDADGSYYIHYHPTDVRFERKTTEEMYRDADTWSMLCDWANNASDRFSEKNGLTYAGYGNTEVDMLVAGAAWGDNAEATLSTTEYGPVSVSAVDGTPWAEFVLQGWYWEVDPEETPDGEYVVLTPPDDSLRLDFFFAPGNYVRLMSGTDARLYQAMWCDDGISFAEAMRGWYYAALEKAGLKPADESLLPFCGDWAEKIAGRGRLTITPSLAPGKVRIEASWPESAAVLDSWAMTAALTEDGTLVYDNGVFISTEYGEDGEAWEIDADWGVSGTLSLSGGELNWQDSRLYDADNSFIRSK